MSIRFSIADYCHLEVWRPQNCSVSALCSSSRIPNTRKLDDKHDILETGSVSVLRLEPHGSRATWSVSSFLTSLEDENRTFLVWSRALFTEASQALSWGRWIYLQKPPRPSPEADESTYRSLPGPLLRQMNLLTECCQTLSWGRWIYLQNVARPSPEADEST
jgi:hypothetical protein